MFLTVALLVVRVVLLVAPLLMGQCGPNGCLPQRGIRASYQPVYMPQGVTYQQPMPGAICGPNGCQPIMGTIAPACGVNGCMGNCPGGCSCSNCPAQAQAAGWVNTGPGTWEKRAGGKIIATWNEQTRELRSEAAGDVMTDPKPEAKPATSVETSSIPPTGLDWNKVADYQAPKKPRHQLYEELGLDAGNGIPHDGEKSICTFTSPDPNERKQFEQLWESAPEFAPFKGLIRCKTNDPEDPVLKDRDGVKLPYTAPGFHLAKADGTNYQFIPAAEASPQAMAEALYKFDPTFRQPAGPDSASSEDLSWLIGIVVAVLVLGFMVFAVLGLAAACYLYFAPTHTGEPENAVCNC